MADKPSPKMVQLILVSTPSPVPANSRLKRLLKNALREYFFRCARVEDIDLCSTCAPRIQEAAAKTARRSFN